ncbi:3-dehydroquinate synthase family protein [Proteinivorax hydrogeniformans]|uniref:3-dehydroquinate synthase family protein n=1 Tax=Proteinivorax hydrogeniformans TaxID=1826727 RepID=A0AAU8HR47_9FIRM
MRTSRCFFGKSSWKQCAEELADDRAMLVIDHRIKELYADKLASFKKNFQNVDEVLVKNPEEKKSLDFVKILAEKALDFKLNRGDWAVAIGGGAVLDLAGFFASIYKRGAKLCYLPTTIIAQVDSAYGGKTAVNFGEYKNQLGSFYPADVIGIDTSVLRSLPKKEVYNGLGEVAKYVMLQPDDFVDAKGDIESILNGDISKYNNLVPLCFRIKEKYVDDDFFDTKGKRVALNLGHTIGHAIEKQCKHPLGHGQAVAIGLNFALFVAFYKGKLGINDATKYYELLKPILPGIKYSVFTKYVQQNLCYDKKADKDKLVFIYPLAKGWATEKVTLNFLNMCWNKFAEVNGDVGYFKRG